MENCSNQVCVKGEELIVGTKYFLLKDEKKIELGKFISCEKTYHPYLETYSAYPNSFIFENPIQIPSDAWWMRIFFINMNE